MPCTQSLLIYKSLSHAGASPVIAYFQIEPFHFFAKSLVYRAGWRSSVDLQAAGLHANPVNLWLSVIILCVFVGIPGGVVVDRFPCWIGIPNCDESMLILSGKR